MIANGWREAEQLGWHPVPHVTGEVKAKCRGVQRKEEVGPSAWGQEEGFLEEVTFELG